MKVVHIFKDYYPPTTGGIEQHMNLLCRKLAADMQVDVLVPSRSTRRVREFIEGVRVLRVPEFGRYASTPLCLTAALELRRLRPDIVHLHFPNPMGDIAYLLAAAKVPLVITYHADIIKQKAFLPVYRPILKCIFRKAHKIIFSAAENVTSSSVPVDCRAKITVIPFAVDPKAFTPDASEAAEIERLRRQQPGGLVLFLGAARYYKGIEILLQAMIQVQGRVILAGRETEHEALKKRAERLGVRTKVSFWGEVSESQRRILLNAADVFVLPSIDRCETFGIVQLEAMACGKPVISTDLPTGLRSVNRHMVTGLVVPPGDPCALAQALNLLLSREELRTNLGANARRHVELHFRVEDMVQRTKEVYYEVLQK